MHLPQSIILFISAVFSLFRSTETGRSQLLNWQLKNVFNILGFTELIILNQILDASDS